LDATGTATVSGSFPASVYFTTATYNGDTDFTGSSDINAHTVEQASTTTTITSGPDPASFGAAVTVTATVAAVVPGAGVPTGAVSFTVDGGGLVEVPLEGSGQVSFVTSALAAGEHFVTVVYSGDTDFAGSTGSGAQTVVPAGTTTAVTSRPDPSVFGQLVTLIAIVESLAPGEGSPVGTVDFTISGPGGGTVTGAVDESGTAAVTISTVEAGAHTVTALYSGDADFTPSTGTHTQTVAQAATTTAVTSSPDASAFGDTVTLTAVVTPAPPGAGTPTGTVTFTLNGSGGGTLTGTLDANGVATASISTLDFGTHAITALYSGDGNFGLFAQMCGSVRVMT
jgi:hypothetical protein